MINLLKTDQQIIAEIHNEFDTAQDRLLDQSEKLLCELNIPTESSIEKQAERLKSIGFVNTPTVGKAESLKKHREANIQKVVETKEQAETIRYYKQTYPFLKFITEDELNRICDKYNLIHAPVKNYTKDVPEKNLRDIERAQRLQESDRTKIMKALFVTKYWFGVSSDIKEFLKNGIYVDSKVNSADITIEAEINEKLKNMGFNVSQYLYHEAEVRTIDKSGLFIAAPASHFNLKGLKKESEYGFFNVTVREVKDPIVFRYVRGGIQILTMWGLEAEDPALVNPINN